MPRNSRGKLRLLVAAMVGCLVPLVVMGPVEATLPTATKIRIDSITTPGVTVPNTPDSPAFWVAKDTPFTVKATWVDNNGNPAPFSYLTSTTVLVTAISPLGTVNLGSITAPALSTSATFSRTLTDQIDDVHLHLQTQRSDSIQQGDSVLFDVQGVFKETDATTTPYSFIGGAGVDRCVPVNEPGKDVCFDITLPPGLASGQHLTSLGNCDIVNPCAQDRQYWWSLVNVTGGVAITDMGMDKSLREEVFPNGVPKAKWLVKASGVDTWVEAPPCPSRGTIGPEQDFCQDFAAGHKDNSGDLWIRLLWKRDIRGSTH